MAKELTVQEQRELLRLQLDRMKNENSTDCIIIKDGRQTRRVSKAIADHAMENVDKLFK